VIATSAYRFLLLESAGGIANLTLNRPEKRNALSLEVMLELIAALEAIGSDRAIRVVVLRGIGPAFSAGHDLREMLDRSVIAYRETFDTCVKLMEKLQSIPQPVIAEIAGIATAAGAQLVATCDLAVAALDAKFATPGVKIGLFCTTPMVALTRAIGRKRAMEMLLTGEFIDAATAVDWASSTGRCRRPNSPRPSTLWRRKSAPRVRSLSGLGKPHFMRRSTSISRRRMPMRKRS